MMEVVVTHYLGFSAKLISFIVKILIGYVAKNRSKSPSFYVTLISHSKSL